MSPERSGPFELATGAEGTVKTDTCVLSGEEEQPETVTTSEYVPLAA